MAEEKKSRKKKHFRGLKANSRRWSQQAKPEKKEHGRKRRLTEEQKKQRTPGDI